MRRTSLWNRWRFAAEQAYCQGFAANDLRARQPAADVVAIGFVFRAEGAAELWLFVAEDKERRGEEKDDSILQQRERAIEECRAAEREAGFIEQIVLPLLKQRNPEARQRAHDNVTELTRLGQALRAVLLRNALRDQLGG